MVSATLVKATAFGLAILVCLAAVLSWYFFYYASSRSTTSLEEFFFEGTEPLTSNKIRLYVTNPSGSSSTTRVKYEIWSERDDGYATVWRSQYNIAETDSWYSFFAYDTNTTNAGWKCLGFNTYNLAGTGEGYTTYSGSQKTMQQLGKDLYNNAGAAEYITQYTLSSGDPMYPDTYTEVTVPVILSGGKLMNFGGFAMTSFISPPPAFSSFLTGVADPPSPSTSTCEMVNSAAYRTASASRKASDHPLHKMFHEQDNMNVPNDCDAAKVQTYLMQRVYKNNWPSNTPRSLAGFCSISCDTFKEATDSSWATKGTDTAMICADGSYTYVVFSGSDDTNDWLMNAWIATESYASMSVHKGFKHKWTDIWQSNSAFIDAINTKKATTANKIMFMGHSLGGAVANVAAVWWKTLSPYTSDSVSIATIGAPAAFKSIPANSPYLSIPHYRYVNQWKSCTWYKAHQQDPVTAVTNAIGFSHPTGPLISLANYDCKGDTTWSAAKSISPVAIAGYVSVSLHYNTEYAEAACKARGTPGANC